MPSVSTRIGVFSWLSPSKAELLRENLSYVHDARRGVLGRDSVGHHGETKGTTHGDGFRAGGQGLFGAHSADALLRILLHPHAAAARAATKGLIPVTRHFAEIIEWTSSGRGGC